MTPEHRYILETREGDKRLERLELGDPFIHTTFHVRGWRNALRVLFRRYQRPVHVDADRETVHAVMTIGRELVDDGDQVSS